MAGPPSADSPVKHAHPSHFEKGVRYEIDHVDGQGNVTPRKIKTRGFVVRARDLDTGEFLEIDVDEIKNIRRYEGV